MAKLPSSPTSFKDRNEFLDLIRGVAIILMIIFHLSYDLSLFKFIKPINFLEDHFWYWFPRFIVFLFLLCTGYSAGIVHRNGFVAKRFWPRFRKILFYALVITVVTYFLFPYNWIFFGILHCIAFSSLLVLPFIPRPKLTLISALLILASNLIFRIMWGRYNFVDIAGWLHIQTMDYEPLYPWFGVVLLGLGAQQKDMLSRWPKLPSNPILSILLFCGRHGLIIYLLHQPLLYGLLTLMQWTLS